MVVHDKERSEKLRKEMLLRSSVGYGIEGALPQHIGVLKGIGTDYRHVLVGKTKYNPVYEGVELRFASGHQTSIQSLTLEQARELRDILNGMELREIHNQNVGLNTTQYEYKTVGELFYDAFPKEDPKTLDRDKLHKFFIWLSANHLGNIVLLPFSAGGAHDDKWDASFEVGQNIADGTFYIHVHYNTAPSGTGDDATARISLSNAFRWVAMVVTTMDVYMKIRESE